jgi:hypothetical protein
MHPTEELFEWSNMTGFFRMFFPEILKSQDQIIVRSSVFLVDAFSRLTFFLVVPTLIAWLAADDET